ncbi:MAG: hypothetical protein KIT09_27375 [Bryobacteraceae bacterium]|nr:hypothetical protein [Bryobacteraceae bacterium]
MDQPQERVFTIVLGARHLVLGLFSAFVLFIALGAVGVLMVRAFLPGMLQANEAAPREQVLVVDADAIDVSRPVASLASGAAPAVEVLDPPPAPARTPAPQPVNPPKRAALPPLPPANWSFGEPGPGQLFFQAVSTSRSLAAAAAGRLARQGLPCLVAAGNDERSFRVLVGPVESWDKAPEVRERLERLGYRPFPRQYKKTTGQ